MEYADDIAQQQMKKHNEFLEYFIKKYKKFSQKQFKNELKNAVKLVKEAEDKAEYARNLKEDDDSKIIQRYSRAVILESAYFTYAKVLEIYNKKLESRTQSRS